RQGAGSRQIRCPRSPAPRSDRRRHSGGRGRAGERAGPLRRPASTRVSPMTSNTADLCSGRWPSIFMQLGFGFSDKLLAHKNVPCPVCGGTDRFQFSDKGEGIWFCRGCNRGGGGVQLVMHMKRLGFKEATALIDSVLGRVSATPAKPNGDSAPKL